MIYKLPGNANPDTKFKSRFENYIGGEWIAPVQGLYFNNLSPVNGEILCEAPRSSQADIDLALDKCEDVMPTWSKSSVTERSNILLKIADRIEENIEELAVAETWENGKPIRESLNADLPLVIDQFRYFAGCVRAQESGMSEIDSNTLSYHLKEPVGIVGQIIPWNFPLLMAAWKLAPAIASGCCSILKPAEQTPCTVLILMSLIGDLLPPGVVNVVNGYGDEVGRALASSSRINKLAFTGSTEVGASILSCAAQSIIPCTVELGGKSPNIFMEDVMSQGESYINKAVEGVLMAFLNQGEVCTCPSRALIQSSIYDDLMDRVLDRANKIKQGNPLDTDTMVGAQVSSEQLDKVMGYMHVACNEGAKVLLGGQTATVPENLANGYYVQPTILEGKNSMQVFQEEIFGPTLAVTSFDSVEEALEIANDTVYGLGAGVWTRDMNQARFLAKGIEAGRIWVNCYHLYPAHTAFGGYKKSGVGRECHGMSLDNYQQTKSVVVSYDESPMGFF